MEVYTIPDTSWEVLDVRNTPDQTPHTTRENHSIRKITTHERMNIETLAQSLDKNTHYVIVCYRGRRSLDMAKELRKYGINAYSLKKGFDRFSQL